MLNYVADHIHLADKRSKTNKTRWVDEVRESITKKCFVVENIVARFNSIQVNERKALALLMKTLSELSVGFSYDTIVRVCFYVYHVHFL